VSPHSTTTSNAGRALPNAEQNGAVLITGATGFVGMEVLSRYLERTDRPVYALVRGDADEASGRLRATVGSVFGSEHAFVDRVAAVPGDITLPALGLDRSRRDALAEEVSEIVHCAASVSFELGLEESRLINVEGTRRMLDLAELCQARGGLRRLAHVSTAYVAGRHAGRFHEDELDVGQRFRNAYEQSKFEAEQLVRSRRATLPVKVFRPSIVVGERATGWTPSFNVLYWPLRAFTRGAYPLLPARREAPVDVVPVDYVADAIFTLAAARGGDGETYHLTAGADASNVGELVELAAERFDQRPPRIVPPWLYRRLAHPMLVRATRGARRRLLRRSETYFPYFAMELSFDDRRARAMLEPAGIRPAPLPRYFDRLVDFAIRAQWGRKPLTRAQAKRLGAAGPSGP
jgi:thioester reductase-like protein